MQQERNENLNHSFLRQARERRRQLIKCLQTAHGGGFIIGISDSPMTIQYEIKSQLAKLLATEDVVEHKKVETASFNVVKTRVTQLMK